MQVGIGDVLLQDETVWSGWHNVRMAVRHKNRGLDICQTFKIASIGGEFENRSELCLCPGPGKKRLSRFTFNVALVYPLPPGMAEGEAGFGRIEEKVHHVIFSWWLIIVCSSAFQNRPRRQSHTFADSRLSARQDQFVDNVRVFRSNMLHDSTTHGEANEIGLWNFKRSKKIDNDRSHLRNGVWHASFAMSNTSTVVDNHFAAFSNIVKQKRIERIHATTKMVDIDQRQWTACPEAPVSDFQSIDGDKWSRSNLKGHHWKSKIGS